MIARRCGRLANRLVLFANFIALAEEQGDRVVNFTFHSYASLFDSTRQDVYCQYPRAARRSLWDAVPGLGQLIRQTRVFYHTVRVAAALTERLPILHRWATTLHPAPGSEIILLDGPEVQSQIGGAKIVFVQGWQFRTPDNVRRHAARVREYLRPVERLEQAGREAVAQLRREADVVIGVHVRHGDYRNYARGQRFFPVSRYAQWMHELVEQSPGRKVAFLVCSDEPRSAQEFPGLCVGCGTDSPVSDFCALARCDLIFGPVSSYSQWASYYGDTPLCSLHGIDDRVDRERFAVSYFTELP